MTGPDRSNGNDATRQTLEGGLRCPNCGTSNRPGAVLIALGADGVAVCGVCRHGFRPSLIQGD